MTKFRVDQKKVTYVHWRGEAVQPPKGHFCAYYWMKGDVREVRGAQIDERYVKADVYGPDGEMFLEGVLADSIDALKKSVPELIDTFRSGV